MQEGAMPVVRLHLWMETGDGILFGLGRMQLLGRLAEHGSLKGAARSMGMSYRAAWGKIKQTEKVLGFQLIEKQGGNRSGYQLTDFGVLLLARYREWVDRVEGFAVDAARDLFACEPLRYRDRPRRSEWAEAPEHAGCAGYAGCAPAPPA